MLLWTKCSALVLTRWQMVTPLLYCTCMIVWSDVVACTVPAVQLPDFLWSCCCCRKSLLARRMPPPPKNIGSMPSWISGSCECDPHQMIVNISCWHNFCEEYVAVVLLNRPGNNQHIYNSQFCLSWHSWRGSVWVYKPNEVDSFSTHSSALSVAATCQIWWKFVKF